MTSSKGFVVFLLWKRFFCLDSSEAEEEECSFIKSLTEHNDIQSRQGDCRAERHYKVDICARIYMTPCPTRRAITQFYLQTTPCLPWFPSRRASPPFGWYSFYRPTEGRRLSRPVLWFPLPLEGLTGHYWLAWRGLWLWWCRLQWRTRMAEVAVLRTTRSCGRTTWSTARHWSPFLSFSLWEASFSSRYARPFLLRFIRLCYYLYSVRVITGLVVPLHVRHPTCRWTRCFRAVGPRRRSSVRPFVRLSRHISLPRYLVNGSSSIDEYSLASILMTWLYSGGQRSRSQQAVEVGKASTSTLERRRPLSFLEYLLQSSPGVPKAKANS